ARAEGPQAAAGALGADEQVTRRSLEVVTADVAAEGRLATHAPEGRDAGHAVDRPGVLAAGSRDIGLLAVEVGQDLVDAPQRLFVHTLPPDRLRAATSPLTQIVQHSHHSRQIDDQPPCDLHATRQPRRSTPCRCPPWGAAPST